MEKTTSANAAPQAPSAGAFKAGIEQAAKDSFERVMSHNEKEWSRFALQRSQQRSIK